MCRGEDSPLAMKRSIRTASKSSGGGVRRHLLLYNSANRPTHQFSSTIQPTDQPTNFALCATDFSVKVVQIFDTYQSSNKKKGHKNDPVYVLLCAHYFPQNTPVFEKGY
jgi:hypothetical protein